MCSKTVCKLVKKATESGGTSLKDLQSHRVSGKHILNLTEQTEIKGKLSTMNTVYEYTLRKINNEKEHWQDILTHNSSGAIPSLGTGT
jgi:hypothetical protein